MANLLGLLILCACLGHCRRLVEDSALQLSLYVGRIGSFCKPDLGIFRWARCRRWCHSRRVIVVVVDAVPVPVTVTVTVTVDENVWMRTLAHTHALVVHAVGCKWQVLKGPGNGEKVLGEDGDGPGFQYESTESRYPGRFYSQDLSNLRCYHFRCLFGHGYVCH